MYSSISCAIWRVQILDGALVCFLPCAGHCWHAFVIFCLICPAFSFSDVDTYATDYIMCPHSSHPTPHVTTVLTRCAVAPMHQLVALSPAFLPRLVHGRGQVAIDLL